MDLIDVLTPRRSAGPELGLAVARSVTNRSKNWYECETVPHRVRPVSPIILLDRRKTKGGSYWDVMGETLVERLGPYWREIPSATEEICRILG